MKQSEAPPHLQAAMPSREEAARYARATTADRRLVEWIEARAITLVMTLSSSLVIVITAQGGALQVSCHPILRPFGLAASGGRLAMSTRREIHLFTASKRLAPHLRPEQDISGQGPYDSIFIPAAALRTGECMTHDMVFDGPSVVFANTKFSCLARADGTRSFTELWRPPFVSQILPEDRCHLNSFATQDGRVRFATTFSATDTRQGFREAPLDGGLVIDVETNAVAVAGLMKPHSVRIFDDKLYVLNSAMGQVLRIDIEARRATCLATLPGFTRGLRCHDGVLLVGLSKMRATARALGMPLMEQADSLVAGLAAIDPSTGAVLGTIRLPGEIEEVLDVEVFEGIGRALVVDPAAEADLNGIETAEASYWMAVDPPLRPATVVHLPDHPKI